MSWVSSPMWWLSLVRVLITQVHVCPCYTETIQLNSPSSVIHLLTSIQNSFIRNFQQQAKLRIHCMSLFGVNPKKRCIKFAYVLELSISLRQSINSCEGKFDIESQNTSTVKQLQAERHSTEWPQLIFNYTWNLIPLHGTQRAAGVSTNPPHLEMRMLH